MKGLRNGREKHEEHKNRNTNSLCLFVFFVTDSAAFQITSHNSIGHALDFLYRLKYPKV